MNRTAKCIIRTLWFSFCIMMWKYMMRGFTNVSKDIVLNDLKFIIPAIIFTAAWTIIADNAIESTIYFFTELFKKRDKKETKKA